MKRSFLKFCQKNYYRGFVFFGIGMGIQVLAQYLPTSFEYWVSQLGLLMMIFSAVLLAIGLIAERRQRKEGKEAKSK